MEIIRTLTLCESSAMRQFAKLRFCRRLFRAQRGILFDCFDCISSVHVAIDTIMHCLIVMSRNYDACLREAVLIDHALPVLHVVM